MAKKSVPHGTVLLFLALVDSLVDIVEKCDNLKI